MGSRWELNWKRIRDAKRARFLLLLTETARKDLSTVVGVTRQRWHAAAEAPRRANGDTAVERVSVAAGGRLHEGTEHVDRAGQAGLDAAAEIEHLEMRNSIVMRGKLRIHRPPACIRRID